MTTRRPGFDEVLIVNPHDPSRDMPLTIPFFRSPFAGVIDPRLSAETTMGYFSESPFPPGYPPGFAAGPEPIGYYAADPLAGYGGWGEPNYGEYLPGFAEYPYTMGNPWAGPAGYGYADPSFGYADPTMGYADPSMGYADPTMGAYAADPFAAYAADPMMGAYADPSMGAYGEWGDVGDVAEWGAYDGYGDVGGYGAFGEYADYGDYGDIAEMDHMQGYDGMDDYAAEPGVQGYVRDVPSPHNAGCPLPTNVNGFGDVGLEGYQRPRGVNPRVTSFTSPDLPPSSPEAFRPLW